MMLAVQEVVTSRELEEIGVPDFVLNLFQKHELIFKEELCDLLEDLEMEAPDMLFWALESQRPQVPELDFWIFEIKRTKKRQ